MNTQAILEAIKSRAEMYDDTNLFIKIANLEKILTTHEGKTETEITKRMICNWYGQHKIDSIPETYVLLVVKAIYNWLEGREQ